MKRKTALTISKVGFHVSFVLFALVATAGPLLLENAGIINTTFNIETSTGSGSSGGNGRRRKCGRSGFGERGDSARTACGWGRRRTERR